jgi:hypothetical protein
MQTEGYRHITRLNLHTKNVFEHIAELEVFKTRFGDTLNQQLNRGVSMSNFPKRLKIIRHGGNFWVQSQFTGEVARLYEIRKIFGMVRDFFVL